MEYILEKVPDYAEALNILEQKAQNWKIEIDTNRKNFSFKDRILYYFEKLTGIRLFDFNNFKIIQ